MRFNSVASGSGDSAETFSNPCASDRPARVAKLTDFIAYGPVNPAGYEGGLIPEDRLKTLATAPENAGTSVFSNADWWLKNGEAAQKAFDEMMNR